MLPFPRAGAYHRDANTDLDLGTRRAKPGIKVRQKLADANKISATKNFGTSCWTAFGPAPNCASCPSVNYTQRLNVRNGHPLFPAVFKTYVQDSGAGVYSQPAKHGAADGVNPSFTIDSFTFGCRSHSGIKSTIAHSRDLHPKN